MARVVALTAILGGADAARAGDGPSNRTFTTSTRTITDTVQVLLDPVPAPECDHRGADPVLVNTTTTFDTVETVTLTLGPAEIMVGPEQSQLFIVPEGTVNEDTLFTTTYEMTEYFQGTEPGPPCAAVLAARFTG